MATPEEQKEKKIIIVNILSRWLLIVIIYVLSKQ